ncbi:MAG: alpha/beta hydrolase [Acidobacteriota bacterium]|nr:alpha/beta hydrolase [Acidobacteriota bacterium]
MSLLPALTLALLVAQSPAPQSAATPQIAWSVYELKTDDAPIAAELGRIRVPERRGAEGSRPITIAFARIRSTAPNPGAPIIYLDGGPGGSGVGAAQAPGWASLFRALRATSDVILLSQRGTGLSDRIGCRGGAPLADGVLASAVRMIEDAAARAKACAASMRAQDVDLAGYTSVESADDIDAIRAALGVPKVSLVGFSYGTHLALATLQRHGARIERVVLLGTEGPDDTWKLPAVYDRQVLAIDALLKADPRTRGVMGNFSETLHALLDRTSREPLTVTITSGGQPRRLQVGAAGILYLLRRDIGDTNDLPWIPSFVYETQAGNLTRLGRLLERRLPSLESGVQMMATAMDCSSAASPRRLATIDAQSPTSIFGALTDFPFPAVCAATEIAPLGEAFRQPVSTRVPALFVSGTLDSNTPPAQAEAVMRGFPNATHIIVEGAGHESTLTPAVHERILAFLRGEHVPSATLPGRAPVFDLPKGGGR